MLLKDLKDIQILNQHDVLAQGIYCYEEQIPVEVEDVNYMNKEGEGVYSILSGTRGEYEIEKITDEKMLNSDINDYVMTEEEYEESCERGDECATDYFYYKQF